MLSLSGWPGPWEEHARKCYVNNFLNCAKILNDNIISIHQVTVNTELFYKTQIP